MEEYSLGQSWNQSMENDRLGRIWNECCDQGKVSLYGIYSLWRENKYHVSNAYSSTDPDPDTLRAGDLFYLFSRACQKKLVKSDVKELTIGRAVRIEGLAHEGHPAEIWGSLGRSGLADMIESGLLANLESLTIGPGINFGGEDLCSLSESLASGKVPRLRQLCYQRVGLEDSERMHGTVGSENEDHEARGGVRLSPEISNFKGVPSGRGSGQRPGQAARALAAWLRSDHAATIESLCLAGSASRIHDMILVLNSCHNMEKLSEVEVFFFTTEQSYPNPYTNPYKLAARALCRTSKSSVVCNLRKLTLGVGYVRGARGIDFPGYMRVGEFKWNYSYPFLSRPGFAYEHGRNSASRPSSIHHFLDLLQAFTLLLKCPQLKALSSLAIHLGEGVFGTSEAEANRQIFDEFAAALSVTELQNLEHMWLHLPQNKDVAEILFTYMENGKLDTLRRLTVYGEFRLSYGKAQAIQEIPQAIAKWLQSGSASALRELILYGSLATFQQKNMDACLSGKLPNLETLCFGPGVNLPEKELLKVALALEVGKLPQLKTFPIFWDGNMGIVEIVQRAFINAFKTNKSLVANVWDDTPSRLLHNDYFASHNEFKLESTLNDYSASTNEFKRELTRLKTQNEVHVKIMSELASQQTVQATHGKVFLCGNPRVGKTTLRRALQRGKSKGNDFERQRCFDIQSSLCGFKCLWCKSSHKFEEPPTRGIEVNHLQDHELDLALWDLAGQHEYEVLHSAFLPDVALADGRATFFIIVCNWSAEASNTVSSAGNALRYWLRFIASNSRKGIPEDLRRHVLVVVNWFNEPPLPHDLEDWNLTLQICQRDFKDFLRLHAEPFILNAKKHKHVAPLRIHLQMEARAVLQHREVPQICAKILEMCKDWASNEAHKIYPVLSWEEFCVRVVGASVPLELLTAATVYLHEAGHLIVFRKMESQGSEPMSYFTDRALLILDPEWLCRRVIGELLLPDSLLRNDERSLLSWYMEGDGSLRLAVVQQDLFQISQEKCEQTVDILVRLGLGYRISEQPEHVFIPALIRGDNDNVPGSFTILGEGTASSWVMGFSLSSRDSLRTLLPVAVLRKLQVNLAEDTSVGLHPDSKFKAGVTRLSCDWKGMGVVVEYHGDPREPNLNRIDILVKPHVAGGELEREKQVELAQEIVSRTLDVALDCCPGLELERSVIKPWMCSSGFVDLHHTETDFYFPVEDMTDQLRKGIEETMGYDETNELFATSWNVGGRLVNFRDVLAQKDWRSVMGVFQTRCEVAESALERLCVMEPTPTGTLQSVEKGLEIYGSTLTSEHIEDVEVMNTHLLMRLQSDIRQLRYEVRTGVDRLDNSIQGVTKKVDGMLKIQASMNTQIQSLETFTVMEKQTSLPRFVYMTSKQGTRWALPRIKDAFSEETFLHFWCEAGAGDLKMHEVEGQEGVDVRHLKEWARQLAPILSWSLKIGFVAAKVAGSAVLPGLGIFLPGDLNNIFQNASRMADGVSDVLKLCSDFENGYLGDKVVSSSQEKKLRGAARAFVKEILRKMKPHNFKQKVGLTRVRIADVEGATKKVAWVCETCCKNLGNRAEELDITFS